MLVSVVYPLVQANKVREEHSEDMSVLRALSIVFKRRPDLRSLVCYESVLIYVILSRRAWC